MGLGDILGGILGSKNTFSAQPMNLDTVNYNKGIEEAQKAALGNLQAGSEAGGMQKSLAQQLMEQSQGQGPSLAQMQLQQGADQNIKNQAALIASQRGMNPAQAARAVAMQGAAQGQDLANKAAQLRLNEQLQKQQLLSQTLQGQRGQDIGLLGAQTGLLSTTGQLGGSQQAREMENYWNAQKINADIASQNAKSSGNLMGGLLGGAASILAGPAGGMLSSGLGSLFGGGAGAAPMAGSRMSDYQNLPNAQGSRMQDYQRLAFGGAIDPDATPADYNGSPEMSRVLVSPGEKVVNSDGDVMKVPGKAKHKGDDERNDMVIADLRRDSVVIPRSKSGDKEKMIEFLKHVKESSKKKSDLQELLDTHKDISDKLEELKYKMGKYRPK